MARVLHKCEQCGIVPLIVTNESEGGAIEGYCSGCGRNVFGAYVPFVETAEGNRGSSR
jgi:hypothetical protein